MTACIICNPTTGDPNTMCTACLRGELVADERAATPDEIVANTMRAALPLRFHHVNGNDLLPELAPVDPATTNVILEGPAGRGKTHQAAALARLHLERNVDHRHGLADAVRFVNAATLVEQLRAEQRREGGRRIIDDLVRARMLIIDDLGAEKPTEWVRERVYDLINQRYEHRRGTTITTNLTPAQLADQIGERSTGRLMEDAVRIRIDGQQRRRPAGAA